MEGTRPLLVEIPGVGCALFSWYSASRGCWMGSEPPVNDPCSAGSARRVKHQPSKLLYLNVAGGLRINEPAADLAAAAFVSSLAGAPLSPETVYFGEIGLSGAIRPVARAPARLKEAGKPFNRAVCLPY